MPHDGLAGAADKLLHAAAAPNRGARFHAGEISIVRNKMPDIGKFRLLLQAAAGLDAAQIIGFPERHLSADAAAGFVALIERRKAAGGPLDRCRSRGGGSNNFEYTYDWSNALIFLC